MIVMKFQPNHEPRRLRSASLCHDVAVRPMLLLRQGRLSRNMCSVVSVTYVVTAESGILCPVFPLYLGVLIPLDFTVSVRWQVVTW